MKQVKHVLETKAKVLWTIPPDATVYQAIELMAKKQVGALLVVEAEKLVGVVTERDYVRKVALEGRESKTTPVGEIMSKPVMYVGPDETLERCMALMILKQVRHLPVLQEGELVSIVSMRDLVKAIIAEQANLIQQLERYIIKQTTS